MKNTRKRKAQEVRALERHCSVWSLSKIREKIKLTVTKVHRFIQRPKLGLGFNILNMVTFTPVKLKKAHSGRQLRVKIT